MQGLLLIDKPVGWTSFDAVNYIRNLIARHEAVKPSKFKVGHSGTLDPFASGLLILLIGSYTKRARELAKLPKCYDVGLKLGYTSATGDLSGELMYKSDRQPDLNDIKAALDHFRGEIDQRPPAYSAVKIGGQRAYKLARQGKKVDIEPRTVKIEELRLIKYNYPQVILSAKVSSGTYIRSLVADIGEQLGCGAYTESLRRLSIGPYQVAQAIEPKRVSVEQIEQRLLSLP